MMQDPSIELVAIQQDETLSPLLKKMEQWPDWKKIDLLKQSRQPDFWMPESSLLDDNIKLGG